MRFFGYMHSNLDNTLFLKRRKSIITTLIMYVDDMILIGDDSDEICKLQEYLSTKFEMKHFSNFIYFL